MTEITQTKFDIDGNELTAQQLGYFSFKWSAEMAQNLIEDFRTNKSVAVFPVASSIVENPFTATLYLTCLYSSSYLTFLVKILRTPAQGITEFMDGLKDSIETIRLSNQMPLDKNEQRNLLILITELYRAIAEEFDKNDSRDPNVFRLGYTIATERIIHILMLAYSADRKNMQTPDPALTFGIGHILDDIPTSLMLALQEQGLKLIN